MTGPAGTHFSLAVAPYPSLLWLTYSERSEVPAEIMWLIYWLRGSKRLIVLAPQEELGSTAGSCCQTWFPIFKGLQPPKFASSWLKFCVSFKPSPIFPISSCCFFVPSKVDTSYTMPVLANCTHPMALICDIKINNSRLLLHRDFWLFHYLPDRDR